MRVCVYVFSVFNLIRMFCFVLFSLYSQLIKMPALSGCVGKHNYQFILGNYERW